MAGDDLREPTLYPVFGPNPNKPGTLFINNEYEAELALRLKYEDYNADKEKYRYIRVSFSSTPPLSGWVVGNYGTAPA